MRALVTGASRGIGRATAVRLARDGCDIAVHFHDHADGARVVAEEIQALGRTALVLKADLARSTEIERMASELEAAWDSLDVLVANAGIYPRRSLATTDESEARRILEVNLVAPILLTRRLLPRLRRSPSGRIVFVSSLLAFQGSDHAAVYAATKAGLLGLARSLAKELAPTIRVNTVVPGSIDTDILAADSPAQRAERARITPLGRVGTAEEVADAIRFLVSDESAYVTGASLHVNGGLRFD